MARAAFNSLRLVRIGEGCKAQPGIEVGDGTRWFGREHARNWSSASASLPIRCSFKPRVKRTSASQDLLPGSPSRRSLIHPDADRSLVNGPPVFFVISDSVFWIDRARRRARVRIGSGKVSSACRRSIASGLSAFDAAWCGPCKQSAAASTARDKPTQQRPCSGKDSSARRDPGRDRRTQASEPRCTCSARSARQRAFTAEAFWIESAFCLAERALQVHRGSEA